MVDLMGTGHCSEFAGCDSESRPGGSDSVSRLVVGGGGWVCGQGFTLGAPIWFISAQARSCGDSNC